jgi:predicted phosphodiesterase
MKGRVILVFTACCMIVAAAALIANHSRGLSMADALKALHQHVLAVSAGQSAIAAAAPGASECSLPQEEKSIRFAVIGDSGSGGAEEYQVGKEMEKCREKTGFDFVLMLGDNINGGKSRKDFEQKFENPYGPLLHAGVKFYASLGNHDNSNERDYAPFNMGGSRYYSLKKGNATFIALDSNYMDSSQLDWLRKQLDTANTAWKICYFHHPLYSDGRFHGPDVDLRAVLAPIFEKYGVDLVLSGHDHVYERIKPQNGIYYFVLGNSGELRYHNLKPSPEMLAGFDTDRSFMLVEIAADKFYFRTISRTGQVVDSGLLQRQAKPPNSAEAGRITPAEGGPR